VFLGFVILFSHYAMLKLFYNEAIIHSFKKLWTNL